MLRMRYWKTYSKLEVKTERNQCTELCFGIIGGKEEISFYTQ